MATLCRDVHLDRPGGAIEDDPRYSHVFNLIRYRNRPVGQVTLPIGFIRNGDAELLLQAFLSAARDALPEVLLDEYRGADDCGPAAPPLPRATVAVCTRERPALLSRCLDSIFALPDDGQEVIVIDSGPESGATAEVAGRYPAARYIVEKKIGLSRARNRAVREASHEVIAFTDDDAVVDPAWLRALLRNFDDRLVLCATGLTTPAELETKAQEWHEKHSPFGRGYRRIVHDSASLSPGAAGRAGAGVNMALRRSVLRDVGPFDEALDPGTASRSGGDNDIFYRILAGGYRIVYDPHALSRHFHRKNMDELQKAFYGYGTGVYAAWTRQLLIDRDATVLHNAAAWLFKYQIPGLVRSLLRRADCVPTELILAELRGCLRGPSAYFAARGGRP